MDGGRARGGRQKKKAGPASLGAAWEKKQGGAAALTHPLSPTHPHLTGNLAPSEIMGLGAGAASSLIGTMEVSARGVHVFFFFFFFPSRGRPKKKKPRGRPPAARLFLSHAPTLHSLPPPPPHSQSKVSGVASLVGGLLQDATMVAGVSGCEGGEEGERDRGCARRPLSTPLTPPRASPLLSLPRRWPAPPPATACPPPPPPWTPCTRRTGGSTARRPPLPRAPWSPPT